jgi:uncharacterized protein (TIGR03083 family)
MDYRRTYRAAAVSFAGLIARVPADRWDSPGLGEWTLRDLTGHAVSSALRQVPAVLAAPGTGPAVDSPEGYWTFARSVPAEMYEAAVHASSADARTTGRELGDDPAAMVRELVGKATAALAYAGDDDVVAAPVGGMRVRDWVPTRTFELVVHGMDIAAAAGVPDDMPGTAVAEATSLAARVAAALGEGPLILRALTGRTALPAGFSVL